MNVEELKLIIELVRGLSDTTGTVAIWWIAGHYISGLLTTLFIASTFVFVAYLATKTFLSVNDWINAAKKVSQAWHGPGSYFYSRDDESALTRAIVAGDKEYGRR